MPEDESHINSNTDIGDYVFLTDDIKTCDRGIINTLRSLYNMQKNDEANHEDVDFIEYNVERNKMIRDAIHTGIKTAKKEYDITDDGVLKKTKRKNN